MEEKRRRGKERRRNWSLNGAIGGEEDRGRGRGRGRGRKSNKRGRRNQVGLVGGKKVRVTNFLRSTVRLLNSVSYTYTLTPTLSFFLSFPLIQSISLKFKYHFLSFNFLSYSQVLYQIKFLVLSFSFVLFFRLYFKFSNLVQLYLKESHRFVLNISYL